MTDRQAIGGEFRYFGETKSVWGMVDYDAAFGEIGSFFVQGNWRLPSRLTLTGMVDRRRSPFLSIGNALIGQKETDINVLTAIFTEEEPISIPSTLVPEPPLPKEPGKFFNISSRPIMISVS